jgi:soluble lytic murein transglycosylase-like protein
MAVRTGSFNPAAPGYTVSAGGLADRWKQLIFLAAVLIVAGQAVRWLSGWATPSGAPSSAPLAVAAPPPAREITFVAQGTGTVTQAAELYSIPAGGEVLAEVPKGAAVTIGGVVGVPAGLWAREVLWVQLAGSTAEGANGADGLHGFIAADSVTVNAGTPLRLALRGVPAEALREPASAVRYSGGEGTGGEGDVAAAGLASVSGAAAAAAGDGGASAVTSLSASPGASNLPADFDIAWLPSTISHWRPQILAAARTHSVDPALIALVMLVESGGGRRAQSGSGAVGLMQVMPSTGAGIAQERGITGYTPDKLWEPETNIDFGAYYISQQLKAFGSNDDPDWQQSVELASSAYNGGPGSVQRLLAGGSLPAETIRYRQWVGGMWRERRLAASPTYDTWSRAGGSVLVAAAEREQVSQ